MNSTTAESTVDTDTQIIEEDKTEKSDNSVNKNIQSKGFEVDEKGVLVIKSFDCSLNIKFTNQLAELFQKISNRFKVSPIMDTTTFINTLHNIYQQHYIKRFKKTREFNDEISKIIFPQILRFMWHKKLIQGKLLTQIIEDNIFNRKEIEEASKITIDWDAILKIFEEYGSQKVKEREGEEDKINLTKEEKVDIAIEVTKNLLSSLAKSPTCLPKSKDRLITKINASIRAYAISKETKSKHKQALNGNKQVKDWVFDLLIEKNIIILSETDKEKIAINKDQIQEYLSSISSDIENCKKEALKMEFQS